MFLEYLHVWEVSRRNPWGSPWRYGVPCEPVWVVRTRCMCIRRTTHSTSSYMCIWCTTHSTRSYDTLQRIEEDILTWIFNITHESRQHVSYSIFANWDSDITGPMSQRQCHIRVFCYSLGLRALLQGACYMLWWVVFVISLPMAGLWPQHHTGLQRRGLSIRFSSDSSAALDWASWIAKLDAQVMTINNSAT